jgi:DNA-directed RNA polymerase subunit M/transcription elongation factor TFIIS
MIDLERYPSGLNRIGIPESGNFDGIDWDTETLGNAFRDFQCPKCSSSLVRNDKAAATKPDELNLVCSKCGETADLGEVIEAALNESLWVDEHIAAMEGGDPVVDQCPECFKETYVFAEGKCLNPDCGVQLPRL